LQVGETKGSERIQPQVPAAVKKVSVNRGKKAAEKDRIRELCTVVTRKGHDVNRGRGGVRKKKKKYPRRGKMAREGNEGPQLRWEMKTAGGGGGVSWTRTRKGPTHVGEWTNV